MDTGIPQPDHFRLEETTVKSIQNEGDILVKVLFMSADPYLRSQVSPGGKKPGDAMVGYIVGKVIESKNETWPTDYLIGAHLPFSTIQIVSKEALAKAMAWNLTPYVNEDNCSLGLSIFGMPGATAYGGVTDMLRPKDGGKTLFVSAAAGAVGGMVGQIAKNVYNLKTIGSCGGSEKCRMIKEVYGFDESIDYKAAEGSAETLTSLLREKAADGIDMYYENVGGIHLEAAFNNLNPHGRIAVCGMISQYHDKAPTNRLNLMKMIYTFQRIEGFVCTPWLTGRKGNFLKDMSQWWNEGKVSIEETFFEGVSEWPRAFNALFTGQKKGKVVIRIHHE